MTLPVRVLLIEDNEDDAELVLNELRWGGYTPTARRVETLAALADALDDGAWDVILSDFTLPTTNGLDALRLVRGRDTDTPFLFVSGTIGEDVAVSAMRAGAQDYILKGNLKRLEPAITRELRDRAERRAHRKTAAALGRTETRLRHVFESGMVGVVFWDADGVITEANGEFLRVVGLTLDALARVRTRWTVMFPAESRSLATHVEQMLATTGRCAPIETEIVTARGARCPVLLGAALLNGGFSEGAALVLDLSQAKADRDARRALEAQLQQAQKMELAARVAGCAAHDFNNLLGIIRTNAELIVATDPAPHELRSMLADIVHASHQGVSLTQQLLAFGRQQVLAPRPVNPNQVLTGMRSILSRMTGTSIELRFDLAESGGMVMADPVQLEQIVLNLALNARDAMPAGGTLSIATVDARIDERCVTSHGTLEAGTYVLITMHDTGMGMTARTQSRMFEPFFTTKDPGRGTGLGLAATLGIVAQSGGAISVYSDVGVGTTVKVYLPRVDAETGAAMPAPARLVPAAPSPTGAEVILLVEADHALRSVAASALEQHGYVVLRAADSKDAFAIARRRKGPIHAVVTDVLHQGLTGEQLVERLREARPELRALFTSGHAVAEPQRAGPVRHRVPTLSKPYGVTELLRRIRGALETAPQDPPGSGD